MKISHRKGVARQLQDQKKNGNADKNKTLVTIQFLFKKGEIPISAGGGSFVSWHKKDAGPKT